MFGPLGGPELVLILVLALIMFGPRRLPEIGKSMGKLLAEFRKASHDFQRTIEDEVEAEKYKAPTDAPRAAPPAPAAAPPTEASAPVPAAPPAPQPPMEPTVVRDGPVSPPWSETK
jgi:TatA/E family protein of Tat protein translocase